MATYYWVGGSGTWTSSSTANWSGSSGGAGGAGPVTSSDDVVFDSNSGGSGHVVTVSGAVPCRNLIVNNTPGVWAGTFATAGFGLFICSGSFDSSLKPTTSFSGVNPLRITFLLATSSIFKLSSVDESYYWGSVSVNGVGGNLTVYAATGEVFQILAGTVYLAYSSPTLGYSLKFDYILVGAQVSFIAYPTLSWTPSGTAAVLYLAGPATAADSVKIVIGAYFVCDPTWGNINYPITPFSWPYIVFAFSYSFSANLKFFYGGGKEYPNIGFWDSTGGSSTTINIFDSNIFWDFANIRFPAGSNGGWNGATVVFEAGTTTQVAYVNPANALGTQLTTTQTFISSSLGTQASFILNIPFIYTNPLITYNTAYRDIKVNNRTIDASTVYLNVNNGNNTNIYFGQNQGNFLGLF